MSSGDRVLILGGTFDPIHTGHLIIVERVLEICHLDRCILIPSAIPPHKDRVYTGDSDRLKMAEIATKNNARIEVSDVELRRDEPSYTLVTLKELHKERDYEGLYFLIGADNIIELKTWYNYEKLLELTEFVIVPRVGSTEYFNYLKRAKDGELPGDRVEDEGMEYLLNNLEKVKLIDLPLIEISSTYIRRLIQKSKSIRYLVPDGVLEYIEENALYS